MAHPPADLRWPSRPYTLTPDRLLALQRAYRLADGPTLTLAALADHDHAVTGGRRGRCWPSVQRLAELRGCTARTIQRHLAALEAAGLITRRVRGRARSALTTLHWDRIVADGPGPQPVRVTSDGPTPLDRVTSAAAPLGKPVKREKPRAARALEAARPPRAEGPEPPALTPDQRRQVAALLEGVPRDQRPGRMADAVAQVRALLDAA